MEKRNEAIQRTSEMLLSGWKMLMTSCPICHTALMEKQNLTFCPKCNLPVVTSQDEIPNISQSLPLPPSSLPSTSSFDDKKLQFQSLEEEKKKYDQSQSKQRLTSTRIGERLLLGWTLLAQECRDCNTPLMGLNGVKYCVTCEKNYQENTPQNAADGKNRGRAVESPSGGDVEMKSGSRNASEQLLSNIPTLPEENDYLPDSLDQNSLDVIEEASRLIGEKLLLGWTLLEDVCEGACNGDVPLMKDPKKGRKYCVMCGYVSDPTTHPVISEKNLLKTSDEKKDQKQEREDEEDLLDDAVVASYTKKRLREISTSTCTKLPENSSLKITDDDTDRTVLEILNKKLFATAQRLEGEGDIETSIQLANLVKVLAEGKRELRKLMAGGGN